MKAQRLFKHTILFIILTQSLFSYWGFDAKGVVKNFKTEKKLLLLTLDACGGSEKSSGYDAELISFLKENRIPVVLFVNSRWIDSNKKIFLEISKDPLFDIQNHGTKHLPLSLYGESAYGIRGSKSKEEIIDEVMINHKKISELTGKNMTYFRSGTAHYSDEAVSIVNSLGYTVLGFSINADAGATYTSLQIQKELNRARRGDIIIAHFNHPESQNATGLSIGIKKLLASGWRFVSLKELNSN